MIKGFIFRHICSVYNKEFVSILSGLAVPEAGRFSDPAAPVHSVEYQGLKFFSQIDGPFIVCRLDLSREKARQNGENQCHT